jgi:hypothetical protein
MKKLSKPPEDYMIFSVVILVLIHVNYMFMPEGVYA